MAGPSTLVATTRLLRLSLLLPWHGLTIAPARGRQGLVSLRRPRNLGRIDLAVLLPLLQFFQTFLLILCCHTQLFVCLGSRHGWGFHEAVPQTLLELTV